MYASQSQHIAGSVRQVCRAATAARRIWIAGVAAIAFGCLTRGMLEVYSIALPIDLAVFGVGAILLLAGAALMLKRPSRKGR